MVARSSSFALTSGGKASRESERVPSRSTDPRGSMALAGGVGPRDARGLLSRLVCRAGSRATRRLVGGSVSVPERKLPRGSLCSSRSTTSRCSIDCRRNMIVVSLRTETHNHEQPQMRRKWEDHDTNRGGLEWTNRGPRGSYAPRRGTLARAMLTRDSSYVNTRLTPPGQYTSNDKPVPRTLEPHAGLWPQTHWFTARPRHRPDMGQTDNKRKRH